MHYNFEWDPYKARQNKIKHKISFERSTQLFLDPFAISIFDEEHSQIEDRWITMGKDNNGIVLVVIHTFCKKIIKQRLIRIISARKATKHEIKQYNQGY